MLYPLIESCLPENLIRVYQRFSGRFENITHAVVDGEDFTEEGMVDTLDARLKQLMRFLRSEVENEQKFALAAEGFGIKTSANDSEISHKRAKSRSEKPVTGVATAAGLVNCDVARCVFCGGSHDNESCFKAQKMNLEQKRELLSKGNACFRCLKLGHSSRKCHSKVKCIVCGKSHVTLMCFELPIHKGEQSQEKQSECSVDQVLTNQTSPQVFLQTLRVTVVGNLATKQVRALMDTGSQRSYVLQSTARKLGFESLREERIVHTLFGGRNTSEQRHNCYRLEVSGAGYSCSMEVLDQSVICNPISQVTDGPWLEELKAMNIALTDVVDNSPIEILFGADVMGKLYTGRKHELCCGLFAIETLFGWTLMGRIPSGDPRSSTVMTVFSLFVKEAKVTDLWELDLLGITDPVEKKSKQEKAREAKELFDKTTQVDVHGRYVVKLPWLQDHPPLSSNLTVAKRRLDSTIAKLRSSHLIEKYDLIFKEWLDESIIEQVVEPYRNEHVHYLPHRPVIKESSLTTKIRPVFDASSKEKGSPSLNQCLAVGPNLITLIPTVLLGFRKGKLGVVSDVKKAFLQIAVHEEDRDYLRFLWIGEEEQIKTFRHRRVVFEVSSSPFLLGATIDYHLSRCRENWTDQKNYSLETIDQLAKSLYVDNCLTSVPDEDALHKFIKESSCLMDEAKMDLRGWEFTNANCGTRTVPVLGLIWDIKDDTLSVNEESLDCSQEIKNGPVTKRLILSVAQRIFDPIGFTCPVSLQPKLLLQQLWKDKRGWDAPLDHEVVEEFKGWAVENRELSKIKIPRWICGDRNKEYVGSLHIFCDASKKAYSAVIFLRVKREERISVYLVTVKARVAPLKEITIPRLELLGATIAARLYDSVKENFPNVPAYFWSDSSTVISWIKRFEEWSVFVKNRVNEIRTLTEMERWSHVPGAMNPADLPSRGCSASRLIQSKWWEGPAWLYNDPSDWPKEDHEIDEAQINTEKRKTAVVLLNVDSNFCNLSYFSSYNKTIRMVAWVKRFCFNVRNPSCKVQGTLLVDELNAAEIFVLKMVQKEAFKDEDPRLTSLKSFIDESGLIRLRSQVSQRPDVHDFRFPVVLPGEHPLVRILIMSVHKESCHVGTQGLLSNLRERFWILGGRRILRSVLSQCGICKRHSGKPCKVEPPPLPLDRVRDGVAFEVTGVDLAGPLFLKGGLKAWICLFTCATYRAIHLELVTSLSTSCFIQALRRFVARRVRPKTMYSDNGTNFVGFENACKELDWSAISDFSSARQIQWRFNPPTAAWWGGFWERLIGVVKRLLRKVLGRACLSYEDMLTVLCECENIVNARPLTYVSNDSQDLAPLTPVMFLRETVSAGLPDADIIDRLHFVVRPDTDKN